MDLFTSTGTLRYGKTVNYLVLDVDQGIVDYYRTLMPKWIKTNRQLYPAHISVVRKEDAINKEFWGKYDGELIDFLYSNIVHNGQVYYWLNAWSKRLEDIRLELGLQVDSPYTRPPDGLEKTFHITIGNVKDLVQINKV